MIIAEAMTDRIGNKNLTIANPLNIPCTMDLLKEESKYLSSNLIKIMMYLKEGRKELDRPVPSLPIEDLLFLNDIIDETDDELNYVMDNSLSAGRSTKVFKIHDKDNTIIYPYLFNEYPLPAILINNQTVINTSIYFPEDKLLKDDNAAIRFIYDYIDLSFMQVLSKYLPVNRVYLYDPNEIMGPNSRCFLPNNMSAIVFDLTMVEPSVSVFITRYYFCFYKCIQNTINISFEELCKATSLPIYHTQILPQALCSIIWDTVAESDSNWDASLEDLYLKIYNALTYED